MCIKAEFAALMKTVKYNSRISSHLLSKLFYKLFFRNLKIKQQGPRIGWHQRLYTHIQDIVSIFKADNMVFSHYCIGISPLSPSFLSPASFEVFDHEDNKEVSIL
jgi:hypothetical protein